MHGENIDLNARSDQGFTALMLACSYGHKDVVQLLLDNSKMNIDLNARNDAGCTAFTYAWRNDDKDIVKLLTHAKKERTILSLKKL